MEIEKKLKKVDEIMEKVKKYPEGLRLEIFKYLLKEDPQEKSIKKHKIRSKTSSKKRQGKVSSIGIQIEKLITEDFFNEPKTIGEVASKLSLKGFNVKLPYISPLLIKLVRNGKLIRHKNDKGKYVYHKSEIDNAH